MTIEKLHLGCGVKPIPGFYHVDALDYPHVDRIGPVEDLSFIPDNTVKLIYACHVLEHFGRNEFKSVLAEWCRVLAPEGVLRLAVPDFQAAAELYVDPDNGIGLPQVLGLIVGGQRDQYDYHKVAFDEKVLSEALLEVGFSSVRRWDWRKTEHSGLDDYSQAYLPHMAKDTGRLVSLNLEGVK